MCLVLTRECLTMFCVTYNAILQQKKYMLRLKVFPYEKLLCLTIDNNVGWRKNNHIYLYLERIFYKSMFFILRMRKDIVIILTCVARASSFLLLLKRLRSAHLLNVIPSLCSCLRLVVTTITRSLIGWNYKDVKGEAEKKNLVSRSTWRRAYAAHIWSVILVTVEVTNLHRSGLCWRAKWDAFFRRNRKESRLKKRSVRQQRRPSKLRLQVTRFPLATTQTRLRSSTAGIRGKRWGVWPGSFCKKSLKREQPRKAS